MREGEGGGRKGEVKGGKEEGEGGRERMGEEGGREEEKRMGVKWRGREGGGGRQRRKSCSLLYVRTNDAHKVWYTIIIQTLVHSAMHSTNTDIPVH